MTIHSLHQPVNHVARSMCARKIIDLGKLWNIIPELLDFGCNNVGNSIHHPSRSGDVPDTFLNGYQGVVQTDGYSAYAFLDVVQGNSSYGMLGPRAS